MNRLRSLRQTLTRLYYTARTFRDYSQRLNKWSTIESTLREIAAGIRPTLTPEECRTMANKLGIPDWVSKR